MEADHPLWRLLKGAVKEEDDLNNQSITFLIISTSVVITCKVKKYSFLPLKMLKF